ncbi:MAG: tRNA (adenosine(37)-N6)-dimethylallyltransferase MiaA [Eubacteriales bacterium]
MNQKIKLLAVAGPTASGKSALAVALARRLGGEVISCDSMQIYKGMDIGTGKMSEEEMQGVKHRLLDIAEPCRSFSLSDYMALAQTAIEETAKSGAFPILCGGTGMYLDHLLGGTALSSAPGDEALRAELSLKSNGELYKELSSVDPQSAAATHPNNRKRVLRALEIYLLSGKTKTQWDEESKSGPSPYDYRLILLLPKDRQTLYDRIDRRVEEMFSMGLPEEARRLFAQNPSPTAAQAIGYKELRPYLEGKEELSAALEKVKQASRNYAKRQLTWFRREEQALVLDCALSAEEKCAQTLSALQKEGFLDERNLQA